MFEVYSFFVIISPLSGAIIFTFSLGFKIISEHNKVVFPALTSKINPGRPQYSAGPWATGICGVYHASMIIKGSSFFSFSEFYLRSLQEKSNQLNSDFGTIAAAL